MARKQRNKCTDLRKLASGPVKDSTKPRGFFRVNIVEDQADGSQRIVGDSSWLENLTTNAGRSNYLVNNLAGVGMTVGYMALGTGGAPASTDTTLAGEIMASTQRQAVTFANQGSATALFTATFNSANSFLTTTSNISNIGLFASSTGGILFSGGTFASSSCSTNQSINASYYYSFS